MGIKVNPEMYLWALNRSGKTVEDLEKSFPKLEFWISGEICPTAKQLDKFAKATYTQSGLLLLSTPLPEPLPISDMRTVKNAGVNQPSGNLLDTIYQTQRSQDWYREYAIENGAEKVPFIGSANLDIDVAVLAKTLIEKLDFSFLHRKEFRTVISAYTYLVKKIEDFGILVFNNGVVGNNTNRKLDIKEFRGFTLVDDYAPAIFINASDSPTARIFTLLHELGHIYLGQSALSDAAFEINIDEPAIGSSKLSFERWCNHLAAEILLPEETVINFVKDGIDTESISQLAGLAKCSVQTALIRLRELKLLNHEDFQKLYEVEEKLAQERLGSTRKKTGGNFYRTAELRHSFMLTKSLIFSTLEGSTSYTDAFRLLGTMKPATFQKLAAQVLEAA